MLMNEAYPSKFLKAEDLQGRAAKVTIGSVVYETVGRERKVAMYFQGKERGIILNKTNANAIAAAYGQDTDQWVGGIIELFPTMTDYQGKQVPAIRVRIPPPPRQTTAGSQQGQQPPVLSSREAGAAPYDDGFDDSIPFAPEFR